MVCQNMITAVLLWQPILKPVYLYLKNRLRSICRSAKCASGPFTSVCTILSRFTRLFGQPMHTRPPCLFPNFRAYLTATYQNRRWVYFMTSLQHADKKNADGNSHRHDVAYVLHLFVHQTQTSFDEEGTRKTKYRDNHTYGQERVLRHVRTIWPGGGQDAGDAATQLLRITAVCIYQLRSDDTYVHKQQTGRVPRVNISVNSIYALSIV